MRLLALIFLLAAAPAWAQGYSGTYTAKNPAGNTVTLTLKQDEQGNVTGTLAGNGATFKVQGALQQGRLFGTASGESGTLYLLAQLEGSELRVVLAEPGPGGQPDYNRAQQFVMARARKKRSRPKTAS
jgi:hypothetical protein